MHTSNTEVPEGSPVVTLRSPMELVFDLAPAVVSTVLTRAPLSHLRGCWIIAEFGPVTEITRCIAGPAGDLSVEDRRFAAEVAHRKMALMRENPHLLTSYQYRHNRDDEGACADTGFRIAVAGLHGLRDSLIGLLLGVMVHRFPLRKAVDRCSLLSDGDWVREHLLAIASQIPAI